MEPDGAGPRLGPDGSRAKIGARVGQMGAGS